MTIGLGAGWNPSGVSGDVERRLPLAPIGRSRGETRCRRLWTITTAAGEDRETRTASQIGKPEPPEEVFVAAEIEPDPEAVGGSGLQPTVAWAGGDPRTRRGSRAPRSAAQRCRGSCSPPRLCRA